MAGANKSKAGVPGIPLGALESIKDENIRQVLRALADGWHVRNGSSGSGDNRFITASEVEDLKGNLKVVIANAVKDVGSRSLDLTGAQISRIINDLQAQIQASLLWKELGERVDLIDKPQGLIDQLDEARADLAQEIADRIADVEAEAAQRISSLNAQAIVFNGQIQAEAEARGAALIAEAQARGTAISQEAALRQSGDNQLASLITTLTATVNTNKSEINAAIQTESAARATADTALAAARETLAAQVRGTYTGSDIGQVTSGLIYSEREARVTADAAQVTQINALSASLTNNVNSLTAQISAESTARVNALAAEAADRQALRTQITGGYTGSDLGQLTSGLLYQERVTRSTQTSALAQQISLLTADVGGGFDPVYTWYFDGGVDGWSNATYSAGWITTSSTTGRSMPQAIDGTKYTSVKMRIRRVSPGWLGRMRYTANGSQFLATIPDPNIAVGADTVVEWEMGNVNTWLGRSITAIEFELGASFDIDWIAIGRNGPAASTASIAEEATTRATAISAEASKREALSVKLLGTADPTNATLANISSGLLFDERQLRASGDTLQANRTDALSLKILGNTDPNNVGSLSTLASGLIFDEREARVSANQAMATSISSLTTTVNNNVASINQRLDTLTTTTSATTTALNTITARVGTAEAAIASEVTARANADTAMLNSISAAITRIGAVETGLTNETTSRVNAVNALTQSTNNQFAAVNNSLSIVQNQTTTATNNVAALTSQVNTLQSSINGVSAAVQTEAVSRVTADNDLYAKYAVKIDANGYVSGYGLMSTGNTASPTSEFIVRADRFAIGSPSGPGITPAVPFIVKTTTTVNPDGSTIPPGVYMSSAYVKELSGAYIYAGMLEAARIYTGSVFIDYDSKAEVMVAAAQSWIFSTLDGQNVLSTANTTYYGPNYHNAVQLNQRLSLIDSPSRFATTTFQVSAVATVDHWFTLHWRDTSVAPWWTAIATTYDPISGYGSVSLVASISIPVNPDSVIEFGVSATNPVGQVFNPNARAIENCTIAVTAFNL